MSTIAVSSAVSTDPTVPAAAPRRAVPATVTPLDAAPRGRGPDRALLAERLDLARARTDAFFDLLTPRGLYQRAIAERHRVVFYVGHLEAFDWNLLARSGDRRPAFDPAFDRLFAFGIDPVDGELPSDVPGDWPSLEAIRSYVRRVRAELDELLAVVPLDEREASAWEMAIEHRLMHAETLAYMLPNLPLDALAPDAATRPGARVVGPDAAPRPGYDRTGRPGRVERVRIPSGCATLGRRRGGAAFGWDNEFEGSVEVVPAFWIDARNVTNGEYLAFVEAGGYREAGRSLWTEADWAWRSAQGLAHPVLWRRAAAGGKGPAAWRQRFAFHEGPLAVDLPVQVSLAEARAFARWRGARLPTEAEFHRAAYGTRQGEERPYPWGAAEPVGGVHGAFDFVRFDPAPVAAYPAGDSAFGVADLVGNGWEWTETVFAPFPGFAADPRYPGYSANFFDGKHHVIKGASPQTARVFLRRSFRNWFQPHYPYVFAAFRCVDPA